MQEKSLAVYEDARRLNDDIMMRHLRQRMANEERDQRDAASAAGVVLRKRAREEWEEEQKRRKSDLETARLAANESERIKQAIFIAQEKIEQTRLTQQQVIINRRDAEEKHKRDAQLKAHSRWLQTE